MPQSRRSQQFPRSGRRWVWALAAAVAVHACLLGPGHEAAAPSRANAGAASIRLVPAQALPVASPPTPVKPKARAIAKPARPVDPDPPAQATDATAPSPAPTVIAPPVEWRYELRQNGKQGLARLSWQPEAGGYRLLLERELEGKPLPGWRSQGEIGAQGLAPVRYATQRKGHDAQATNFRRDEGIISFSASTAEVALAAGVQDRISWWLQLGALVAGAPQRFGPGSEIRVPVIGLRGEPQDWIFEVIGEEALVLPGAVTASSLHLRRASIGLYDNAIDVWLDPARGYLPAKLTSGSPGDRGWEMQRVDASGQP